MSENRIPIEVVAIESVRERLRDDLDIIVAHLNLTASAFSTDRI